MSLSNTHTLEKPTHSAAAIDYFNKQHPFMRLQTRFSIQMRQRMLNSLPLRKEMRVLEVGATPDTELADSNFFSRQIRSRGNDVWISSPEDCSAMAARNDLKWVPFDALLKGTQRFDVVISSAVLEHVGSSHESKLEHLRLLDKVATQLVMVSTPNRYHWLEFHTKLPLIHWLPKSWHRALLRTLGMKTWGDPNHLDLLNFNQFDNLINAVFTGSRVTFQKLHFLGATSNLMALIDKRGAS
jgi:2-polyprenyl-3-methyl-5-hydroxy-6-metoxy-1,4-benzoquinol methylase